MSLIDDFDKQLHLGVSEMDDVHRELVELIDELTEAEKSAFVWGFLKLLDHTAAHFDEELMLMRQSDFQALEEHNAEHERILDDLNRFAHQVVRGRVAVARAYLRERIPEWFVVHASTMDSDLATHLKATGLTEEEAKPQPETPNATNRSKSVPRLPLALAFRFSESR